MTPNQRQQRNTMTRVGETAGPSLTNDDARRLILYAASAHVADRDHGETFAFRRMNLQ